MILQKTYSVIIVPSDHARTRQFQVSRFFILTTLAFLLLVAITMLVFAATYTKVLAEARRAQHLEIENERLTEQVVRVNELSRELEAISGLRAQLFNMLGAVDDEGGPTVRSRALESHSGESILDDTERLQVLFAEESRKPFAPRAWPLDGRVRKEFFAVAEGSTAPHPGLSIEARPADIVRAAGTGRVVRLEAVDTDGTQAVELDHGYGFRTVYRGLSRADVLPGQAVVQGQALGLMNPVASENRNPGSRIAGAVLYFEIRVDGTPVDPRSYLTPR